MKPTVLIIGEAKCGTSAMFAHLVRHSHFCTPPRKEVHYFDRVCRDAWNHAPGFTPDAREYQALLASACLPVCDHAFMIDATPSYLRTPGVERFVQEMVHDPRIVVLLRNPIDRLYSNYWMHQRRGRVPRRAFDDFVDEYIRNDLHRTARITFDYATNLSRWFRCIPDRRRFFICFHETMIRSPGDLFMDLGGFLGVPLDGSAPPVVIPAGPLDALPTQHYPPMVASIRSRLDEYFSPFDDALARLLDRDLPWR